MIYLDETKDYFILIDGQGANFASGVIFESLEELATKFRDWAEADGHENPTLKGWSLTDCLEFWTFELKEYRKKDFFEVDKYSQDKNKRNILSFKL